MVHTRVTELIQQLIGGRKTCARNDGSLLEQLRRFVNRVRDLEAAGNLTSEEHQAIKSVLKGAYELTVDGISLIPRLRSAGLNELERDSRATGSG